MRAEARLESLAHLVKSGVLRAENGRPGEGGKRHGRDGDDLVGTVPVGTTVTRDSERPVVLDSEGKEIVVGHGGRGGMGNAVFASAINRAPRIAQRGQAGEEGVVRLEMVLAPDIAIIGMPNSGKSTLLHRLTGVQTRIAEYPFTTSEVVKGVYEREGKTYLAIETPGIVEGSHAGKGLGLGFGRHLRKAWVLVHLVDGRSPDVAADIETVRRELAAYDPILLEKPEVVAVNRVELPEVRALAGEIGDRVGHRRGSLRFISALTGEGLEALMETAIKAAERAEPGERAVEESPEEPVTINLLPEGKRQNAVFRKKGVVVIESPDLEDVVRRTDIFNQDAQAYLKRQFVRTGVARLLKKEGVRVGDRVRCGGVEWEWQWPL